MSGTVPGSGGTKDSIALHKHQVLAKSPTNTPEPDSLREKPAQLLIGCDLGPVLSLICASTCLSTKWD